MADKLTITDLTKGIYRRVYAGFLNGKRINSVTIGAEHWFWRVHAIADDFGNFRDDTSNLRVEASPRRKVTEQQVKGWMGELVAANLLIPYVAEGDSFVHINGFVENQPSGKNGKRVRRVPEWCGESKSILDNPEVSGKILATVGESSASHSHSDTHTQPHTDTQPPAGDGFSRFWSAWPKHCRKEDKAACLRKWTTRGCEPIADEVLAGLARWKSSHNWTKQDGEFVPAPLVWLNKRRWETAGEVSPAGPKIGPLGVEIFHPTPERLAEMLGGEV